MFRRIPSNICSFTENKIRFSNLYFLTLNINTNENQNNKKQNKAIHDSDDFIRYLFIGFGLPENFRQANEQPSTVGKCQLQFHETANGKEEFYAGESCCQ
jgi:hypothetical protein